MISNMCWYDNFVFLGFFTDYNAGKVALQYVLLQTPDVSYVSEESYVYVWHSYLIL